MLYAEFISVVEEVNLVLGIILCSFLLFCLLFRTRHDLGTYRYLQITMVSVDVSYTIAQMFIRERIVTAEGVFGMVPASPLVTDKAVLCAYVSFYTITFVMIDYSFLYRMWAVKSPLHVALFSKPIFIILLISLALLECFVWFISVYYLYLPTEWGRRRLRESTFIDFGIDTQSAVMVMGDYFLEDGSVNVVSVGGVGISVSIMGLCFGFMIYATFNIIHNLKAAKLISKNTLRLQRQLFVTLCLQTIIPLIFLYSPCGVMIVLPLFRVNSQWMARATPFLITFFLPLDALAVILSMTEYRRVLLKIISGGCYNNLIAPTDAFDRNSTTVFR